MFSGHPTANASGVEACCPFEGVLLCGGIAEQTCRARESKVDVGRGGCLGLVEVFTGGLEPMVGFDGVVVEGGQPGEVGQNERRFVDGLGERAVFIGQGPVEEGMGGAADRA